MNAICFECKAIHRNVPQEVVMEHYLNNLELRCPRCNEVVFVFKSDDDLFNFRVVIENRTYGLLAMKEDGSEGELTFIEMEE